MKKTDNQVMTQGTLEERIERVLESDMLTARDLDDNAVIEYYLDLRELVSDLLTEVKAQQKELDFQSSINRYNGHILELYKNAKKDRPSVRVGYAHETASKRAKQRRGEFSVTRQPSKQVGKIDLNEFKETLKKEIVDC
tara:strand:+ start:1197 stop:1613 length:417 start_codon:yes stop_codon:yes gene_type:complete